MVKKKIAISLIISPDGTAPALHSTFPAAREALRNPHRPLFAAVLLYEISESEN
jgi:hypothetical protein